MFIKNQLAFVVSSIVLTSCSKMQKIRKNQIIIETYRRFVSIELKLLQVHLCQELIFRDRSLTKNNYLLKT